MRLNTLCLGLGVFLGATIVAQEIIAPEEWFGSMKVAQGLVARHETHTKRHQGRRQHRQNSHHHHHQRNSNNNNFNRNRKAASSSSPPSPRLAKRRWGYPSRLEIEQRATAFNSFRTDEIVDAPANLHIINEPKIDSGIKQAAGPAGAVKIEKNGDKMKKMKVAKRVGKKGLLLLLLPGKPSTRSGIISSIVPMPRS
ncbi:hypothetical protein BGX33_007154 [Mortierella sp. NVP41]|nr:hypothetical protein BGX33_007154 [Mortierella sp. NVP41]